MAFETDPTRRRVLAGGAVLAASPLLIPASAWAAKGEDVAFEVWRQGKRIGAHSVKFSGSGARRTAAIAATMLVKLGPVPLFRYRHDATEVWDGDRFVSLETRSVTNGKVETVSAKREDGGVRIVRSGGATILAAANAAPLTHWNRDALRRPLFHPQTGVLVRESVTQKEGDSVTLADGRVVTACRYSLTGDADIVNWYAADDAWIALKAKATDGSTVDYRRVA